MTLLLTLGRLEQWWWGRRVDEKAEWWGSRLRGVSGGVGRREGNQVGDEFVRVADVGSRIGRGG